MESTLPFVRYARCIPYFTEDTGVLMAADCRIFYIAAGEAEMETAIGPLSLRRGDLLYLPPASPYRFVQSRLEALWSVNFDFSFAASHRSSPLPIRSVRHFKPPANPILPPAEFAAPIFRRPMERAAEILSRLAREKEDPRPLSDENAGAMLFSLLVAILRGEGETEEISARVITYLDEHYREKLDNEQIAAHFSYHPIYLNRRIRQQTGETLHRLLQRRRLRAAADMLLMGEGNVEAVALDCGFADRAHFARLFRKQYGVSPTEFARRKHRV